MPGTELASIRSEMCGAPCQTHLGLLKVRMLPGTYMSGHSATKEHIYPHSLPKGNSTGEHTACTKTHPQDPVPDTKMATWAREPAQCWRGNESRKMAFVGEGQQNAKS